MSPDLPFEFRVGNDEITAIHNRISALERIKFLTGVDLKDKPVEYKQLIDCELYVKFYKDLPQAMPIDEDFCQRAAEVIRILEAENKEDLENTMKGSAERVKQLFQESQINIPTEKESKEVKNKNAFISIIKKFFKNKV